MLFASVFILQFIYAQPVINLNSKGSENWNWSEKEMRNRNNEKIVYNVSHPSLTEFLPDSSIANGTAVIICPGGAFHFLAIDNGGYNVAKYLVTKGITAFVLKYRLTHILSNDPIQELNSKKPNSPKFNEEIKPIVAMDIADGDSAVAYLRTHAAEYNISPGRIGIIGFSAGGTLAAGVAYNYLPEYRPDFVATIYPYIGSFTKDAVHKDALPLFIAAASDDQFGFNIDCLELYKDWISTGHSAKMHIYAKGSHGFSMHTQNLTSDTWKDAFISWLNQLDFLKRK